MELSIASSYGGWGGLVVVGLRLDPRAHVLPAAAAARSHVGEHLLRDGNLKNGLKAIFFVVVGAEFPHGVGWEEEKEPWRAAFLFPLTSLRRKWRGKRPQCMEM